METNSIRFKVDSLVMGLDLCVEKSDEYRQCVFRDELPEVWSNEKALETVDRLFFTFDSKKKINAAEKIYTATVDLCKIPRLEKIYLRQLIYDHFRKKAIVGWDFVGNVEVWTKDSEQPYERAVQYRKFSLAPQYKRFTEGHENREIQILIHLSFATLSFPVTIFPFQKFCRAFSKLFFVAFSEIGRRRKAYFISYLCNCQIGRSKQRCRFFQTHLTQKFVR